jgi:hypothetical protein
LPASAPPLRRKRAVARGALVPFRSLFSPFRCTSSSLCLRYVFTLYCMTRYKIQ